MGVFYETDLLAMVIGWIIQPEFHVLNVAVHPGFRRRGLGRFIVMVAIGLANKFGAHLTQLETRSGDKAAEGLYASLGFVQVGTRQGYYTDGTDAALMTHESPLYKAINR